MTINADEVTKIAHLARLTVSGTMTEDMQRILNFVEQLQQVDVSAVEPMSHPLDLEQRLRPDSVTECDQRQACQAIAPNVEQDYYLVPQVIENTTKKESSDA